MCSLARTADTRVLPRSGPSNGLNENAANVGHRSGPEGLLDRDGKQRGRTQTVNIYLPSNVSQENGSELRLSWSAAI